MLAYNSMYFGCNDVGFFQAAIATSSCHAKNLSAKRDHV